MDIKNCSAIIVGGGSGMGAATAKVLSKAGAKVTIFDLNFQMAEKIAMEVSGNALLCDVTQENSVKNALEKTFTAQGPYRICINCAGIAQSQRMVGKEGPLSLEAFKNVIDINLLGTFNVMRLVAAKMTTFNPVGPSHERGIIINTASIAAFEGQIGQVAYSASKGAVVAMTLPAARELAQFGIRVVTIAPGLVDTPMFDKLPPDAKQALSAGVPFPKRLAYPEEYAKLALHIIENEMINGTVIRLDGALRMAPK